jgi:hypothetical protein
MIFLFCKWFLSERFLGTISFLNIIIVGFREIGVWVWAQILKRVVVGFSWNFLPGNLTSICNHFCQLKKFSGHRWFFKSGKKKKWGGFLIFFRNGLVRNFLCYKSCRKNILGTYFIGRIVNFHFHLILKFSDYWMLRY